MKIVPVIKSGDLKGSVQFYPEVLDFERKWPSPEDREMASGVIELIRDGRSYSSRVIRETVSSVQSIACM